MSGAGYTDNEFNLSDWLHAQYGATMVPFNSRDSFVVAAHLRNASAPAVLTSDVNNFAVDGGLSSSAGSPMTSSPSNSDSTGLGAPANGMLQTQPEVPVTSVKRKRTKQHIDKELLAPFTTCFQVSAQSTSSKARATKKDFDYYANAWGTKDEQKGRGSPSEFMAYDALADSVFGPQDWPWDFGPIHLGMLE